MTPEAYASAFNLPFKEASRFFQEKLNIPTAQWDDLWQAQHAKGFMIAGAQKGDLLSDFQKEIEAAINGDLTVTDFRSKFDAIVKKHGWAYNGGRNWRSDLIYDTNVTTAYQAGRWRQFEDSAAPALKYVHADGVMNPRPMHLAWNGITLPRDHPFWRTHYGPNGWGCHCRVVRADIEEITAPPEGYAEIDPKTGAPKGIDRGWAYNVGAAGIKDDYAVLNSKIDSLPAAIGSLLRDEIVKRLAAIGVEP